MAPFAGLVFGLELLLSSPCAPLPDSCRLLSFQPYSSFFSEWLSFALRSHFWPCFPGALHCFPRSFAHLLCALLSAVPGLLSVHSAQSPWYPTPGEGPGATMFPTKSLESSNQISQIQTPASPCKALAVTLAGVEYGELPWSRSHLLTSTCF